MAMVEVRITNTAEQKVEFLEVESLVESDLPAGQWPPASLVETYVQLAYRHRRSEQMEDGRWFAEVVGLQGVWADGDSQDEAQDELLDVLQGWVELRLERGKHIPPFEGIDLNV